MKRFLLKLGKICLVVLFAIIGLFTYRSCGSGSDGNAAISHFVNKFNKEISKEYGLTLYGSGAGFPVKIEKIILCFQADYRQNVNGARKLAVDIAHKMIERMNQDENLLKYLANHPANISNVDLTIAFKERNARSSESLQSVMVIGARNKIVYNIENKDKTMLEVLLRESFDEAEKIIQQEASS